MQNTFRLIESTQEALVVVCSSMGHSADETSRMIDEVHQKIEKVLTDTLRQAESCERRCALEAKSLLEGTCTLSNLLGEPLEDAMIVRLMNLRTQVKSAEDAAQQPKSSLWPFGRPREPEVDVILENYSLRQVTERLQREQLRLNAAAESRIRNIFALEGFMRCLELPLDAQEGAKRALLTRVANVDLSNSNSRISRTTIGTPKSDRKRTREEDTSVTPQKTSLTEYSDEDSVLCRMIRRQDMSLSRIQSLLTAAQHQLERLSNDVDEQLHNESELLKTLCDKLDSLGGASSHGTRTWMTSVTTSDAPHVDTNSPPWVVSSEDEHVTSLLTPEVVALIWKPIEHAAALQSMHSIRAEVQRQLATCVRDRLDEATVLLGEAYEAYYSITKDPSYAVPPDYSEWLSSPRPSDTMVASTLDSILHYVQDVESAAQRAVQERAEVNARLRFIKEHVVQLLDKRRDILERKDALQNASRERLTSKRGNMAKVLLEEETLRREVSKTLPRILLRLQDLLQEWAATFIGATLYIDGKSLSDIIAADMPCTRANISLPSSPPPTAVKSSRCDKENDISIVSAPSALSKVAPSPRGVLRSFSQPTSRRNSPAPLSNRSTRSATPSPPPGLTSVPQHR